MNLSKSLRVLFVLFLSGCATFKKPATLSSLPDQGPVRLELKPQVGLTDKTEYHSRTITQNYSGSDLTHKIQEDVDFTVDTKVKNVDAVNKQAVYVVSTTEKEGKSDLSDFAMPELGEEIEFIFSNNGKVLRAGEFPPGTLYFVPPISFPEGEVKVGESWPMKADWVSIKSGLPLRIELVSIFKGLKNCGAAGACAEVEVSGDVSIVGAQNNNLSSIPLDGKVLKLRFKSELRGRMLVSLRSGFVLYSYMKSDEHLNGEKDRVEIASCLLSYATEPANERLQLSGSSKCDPNADVPSTY